MKDQVNAADLKKEEVVIQQNSEDSYWQKKYGVSTDDLKKTGHNLRISDRIIQVNMNNKAFA